MAVTEQYKGYEIVVSLTTMGGYNWNVYDSEGDSAGSSTAQAQYPGQNYGYKTPAQAIGAAKRSINETLAKMAGHSPR